MRSLALLFSAVWWTAVMLLAVHISMTSVARFVTGSEAAPEPILANAFATPFFFLHVVSSVIALLVAPLQFVRAVRKRWPSVHRYTGRTYLAACAIAAPTGFVLALGTSAGLLAGFGFALIALLWAAATWLGWRAAIERRFDDHRDWMIRSYALLAGAITLRLYLPAALTLGFDYYDAYPIIAWLSWLTNLAIAESIIRWWRRSRHGRALQPRLNRPLATAD